MQADGRGGRGEPQSSRTSTSCSPRPSERDEYLALAQRTQADFENYRKRMAREVGPRRAAASPRLVKELLPALDNLELRARRPPVTARSPNGVGSSATSSLAALARVGDRALLARGRAVRPPEHEA